MRRRGLCLGACALLLALAAAAPAPAAAGPLYVVKATWGPTNLGTPDAEGHHDGQLMIQARNVGDAAGTEPLTIKDQLPPGVKATAIHWPFAENISTGYRDDRAASPASYCRPIAESATVVSCTLPEGELERWAPAPGKLRGGGGGLIPAYPEPSGFLPPLYIEVEVDPGATGSGKNEVTIEAADAPANPADTDTDQVPFGTTPAPFDFAPGSFLADNFTAAYPFGGEARLASDRPFELRVGFDLTARYGVNGKKGENHYSFETDGTTYIASNGALRTVEATLPRGMIGNPEALPKCDQSTFAKDGVLPGTTACPSNTQVGYLNVSINDGPGQYGAGLLGHNFLQRVPIYNLVPPKGTPSDLGFNAGSFVRVHIYAGLDPAQNYAIKSVTPNISSLTNVRGSEVTIWGVPADPAHDRFRYWPGPPGGNPILGAPFGGAPIRPFLTNPMDCEDKNGGARGRIDSYSNPGEFSLPVEYGAEDPQRQLDVTGCDDPRFDFDPDIALQPTDRHAGAPTGLDVHLKLPQQPDVVENATDLYAADPSKAVEAIATPPIEKVVVTFPPGMTLNPSAAQGLGSCSSAQIGIGTDSPVRCPDSSQYGTLVLHTPLLPQNAQPEGFLYIAKQNDNPFHSFLALYMVIEEPERGLLIKIPGRLDLDPLTGQITSTFGEGPYALPQFPVSDFQLTVKGGVRAGLVNPSTCGVKTIRATFYSWHDPNTPHPVDSNYRVTERPDGSACVNSLAERPFRPQMQAETLNPAAGAYAPFFFRLTRTDDDQELSQADVALPPGLTAKIAGVGLCPEAGIAQATARTGAGEGALEQASPSCPASALIGTTQAGAGTGVPLTYVPGRIYLAGPYRGAPLSMVVITPAIVGPYDLGVVVVRTALHVDPETTQVTARTDPFPLIYQGIPVRIRDVRVLTDRPDFTLNPTSCKEKTIGAHLTGTGGILDSTADDSFTDLTQRFQAASCASLGFKPLLTFRLYGATHRGAHPKLEATLKARPGDANIAAAQVTLPRSEFLDQGHIRTVCTRVQFAADQCPAGSVYGAAEAISPLLDQPLKGPVYLRSSSHLLPDLVVALRGPPSQPIEVNVVGRVDSVRGGIRNTFELVPDAPVTRFTLTTQGGAKGLLVNSTDLCAKPNRALAKFTAQSGRVIVLRPRLQDGCGKLGKRRRGHGRGGGRGGPG